MSGVAAIGEDVRLAGYALAGVTIHPAQDALQAHEAFEQLPADLAVLLLTPTAHAALAARLQERPSLLCVEVPL